MSRRFALLAGINDYEERSNLAPLNFAEADASLMARTLAEKCGFETRALLGRDATLGGISRALKDVYGTDLDLFLFFFAGHGEYIAEVGMHCLHCYGSEAGDTVGTIRLSEWTDRIRRNVSAASSLIVVDACRNKVYRGAQARGAAPGLNESVIAALQSAADSRDIAPQAGGKRSGLMYELLSCGSGQVSYEDAELKQGVFTYALAREVNAWGSQLPVGQLRKRVGDWTVKWCESRSIWPLQIPYWIEPSLSGELFLADPVAPHPDADHEAIKLLGQAELQEQSSGTLLEARKKLQIAESLELSFAIASRVAEALGRVRDKVLENGALEPQPGVGLKTIPDWVDWLLAHPDDAPLLFADPRLDSWIREVQERQDVEAALRQWRTEPGPFWERLESFLQQCNLLSPAQKARLHETQDEIANLRKAADDSLLEGKHAEALARFKGLAARAPGLLAPNFLEALSLVVEAGNLEARPGYMLDARQALRQAESLAPQEGPLASSIAAALSRVRDTVLDNMVLEPEPGTRLKTIAEWVDWLLEHPDKAPGVFARVEVWLRQAHERPDAADAFRHWRSQPISFWQKLESFLTQCGFLNPAQNVRLTKILEEIEKLLEAGDACISRRDHAGALENYGKAAALDPGNVPAANGVRAAQAMAQEYETARAQERETARLLTEADSRLAKGDHAAALELYQKVTARDPGNQQASTGIGKAEAARQQAEEARKRQAAEEQLWQKAKAGGVEAYRAYLAEFPSGVHAEEAKTAIQKAAEKPVEKPPEKKKESPWMLVLWIPLAIIGIAVMIAVAGGLIWGCYWAGDKFLTWLDQLILGYNYQAGGIYGRMFVPAHLSPAAQFYKDNLLTPVHAVVHLASFGIACGIIKSISGK